MTAKCLYRVNLSGYEEAECAVVGDHDVHRYRTRDGVLHRIEFVDYPPRPQVQAAREATPRPGDNDVSGAASLVDTPEG